MRIAIDIDDCLSMTMPVFLDRVFFYYGKKISIKSLNKFSAKTEDYGYITLEQAKKILSLDLRDDVITNLPLHHGAVTGVNALSTQHKVILLTSRNNYSAKLLRQHTLAWLKKHGFKFHKLIFTQDKTTAIKKLKVDLLIDDSLKFAQQAIIAGAQVVLFAQPWNQNFTQFFKKDDLNSVILRANNWTEINRCINNLDKEKN